MQKPLIDDYSRKLVEEKRGKEPTYQRLYDLNKEKAVKKAMPEEEDEKPKKEGANTTMRGDKTLQDFLYEDNKRRQEVQK